MLRPSNGRGLLVAQPGKYPNHCQHGKDDGSKYKRQDQQDTDFSPPDEKIFPIRATVIQTLPQGFGPVHLRSVSPSGRWGPSCSIKRRMCSHTAGTVTSPICKLFPTIKLATRVGSSALFRTKTSMTLKIFPFEAPHGDRLLSHKENL